MMFASCATAILFISFINRTSQGTLITEIRLRAIAVSLQTTGKVLLIYIFTGLRHTTKAPIQIIIKV
jgi:hypothetical protein